jgi:hypothetical protein
MMLAGIAGSLIVGLKAKGIHTQEVHQNGVAMTPLPCMLLQRLNELPTPCEVLCGLGQEVVAHL